jgi:hypothetical protein
VQQSGEKKNHVLCERAGAATGDLLCTATSPQNATCPRDARVPAEAGAADPDDVRLAIEAQLQANEVYPAYTQVDNPVVIDAEEESQRPAKAQPSKVCPILFRAFVHLAGSMLCSACEVGLHPRPRRRETEAPIMVKIRICMPYCDCVHLQVIQG